MKKSQDTNQFFLMAKRLSIVLGLMSLCWLLVTGTFTLLPYINQNNYSYVGTNFADALMQNNSKLAHRLSAPSQWQRIDEWMESHKPLNCPISWDFDENPGVSVAGLSDEERAHVSYFQICSVDQYFEFEIEEIMLERQNNRWLVVDWSKVQEMKE